MFYIYLLNIAISFDVYLKLYELWIQKKYKKFIGIHRILFEDNIKFSDLLSDQAMLIIVVSFIFINKCQRVNLIECFRKEIFQ